MTPTAKEILETSALLNWVVARLAWKDEMFVSAVFLTCFSLAGIYFCFFQ